MNNPILTKHSREIADKSAISTEKLALSFSPGSHNGLIEIRSLANDLLAEVYVEYRDGKVMCYIWDEDAIGNDWSNRILLIEDPASAIQKAQEESE